MKELTSESKNGSYTFGFKYGLVDFYPKSNKLLIRAQNKWKKPLLPLIINSVLQETN